MDTSKMNGTAHNLVLAARAMRLRPALAGVDAEVQKLTDPTEQCAVLFLAHVLALRRLMARYDIQDRGRRMKMLKTAVAEFEAKLRQYVRPDAAPDEILSMDEDPISPS